MVVDTDTIIDWSINTKTKSITIRTQFNRYTFNDLPKDIISKTQAYLVGGGSRYSSAVAIINAFKNLVNDSRGLENLDEHDATTVKDVRRVLLDNEFW